MTKEDVICMAKEAGALQDGVYFDIDVHSLERFAALVAVAEREACAKVCEAQWGIDGTHTAQEFADTIRARGQA